METLGRLFVVDGLAPCIFPVVVRVPLSFSMPLTCVRISVKVGVRVSLLVQLAGPCVRASPVVVPPG